MSAQDAQQDETALQRAPAPGQQLPHALPSGARIPAANMPAAHSRQVQPQPLVSSSRLQRPSQVGLDQTSTAQVGEIGSIHAQPKAQVTVQGLTKQIKQMKNEMLHYASLLDNPAWKQQQQDNGKAVRVDVLKCCV